MYEDSAATTFRHANVLIYGNPGVGKSFAAATISERFPASLPASPGVALDDVAWLLFDKGGLDGFAEQGLRVPKTVNLSLYKGAQMLTELTKATAVIEKDVREGNVRAVIVDTMTAFHNRLARYAKEIVEKKIEAGKESENKEGMATGMLTKHFHMQLASWLDSLPCHVIVLAHAKAEMQLSKDVTTAQAVKAAVGVNGVTPDIGGGIANHYMGAQSLILPMSAEKQGLKMVRRFHPNGTAVNARGEGFQGKNRFAKSLGSEEPANLQAVIAKIRAAAASVAA